MRASMLSAAAALALAPALAGADVTATCSAGCARPDGVKAVNLLFREDPGADVTLTWEGAGDPAPKDGAVVLYAGKPTDVTERGAIGFAPAGSGWRASRTFTASALGEGTFLTVLVTRKGSDERILDWRAWRLVTRADLERRRKVPDPGSDLPLTVRPALLQARAGSRSLPPSEGGDRAPWWSFADLEGIHSDLDLDGDNTGIPGLGVQVSHPWSSRFGEDARTAVKAEFDAAALEGLPAGKAFRFGDLVWTESADRPIALGPGEERLVLRSYYTVVTLYTRASVATLDDAAVGADHLLIDPTYFAHETSARLKHPDHPRFWASYSEREYCTNPKLLRLLAGQVKRGRNVPGLGAIQTDDGDGGTATYTVGLWARIRPWSEDGTPQGPFTAGFVSVDVLAGRAGIGRPHSAGSVGNTFAEVPEPILCKVLRCGSPSAKVLDLDKPPDGYRVWPPFASLSTLQGALLTTEDPPVLGERALEFPPATRFGLVAELRAGALTENAWWGHVRAFTPIDVWAQYVVRFTVAMKPADVIPGGAAVIADPNRISPEIATPEHRGLLAWLGTIFDGAAKAMLAAIVLALAAILLVAFPGVRQALNAVFKLVAALI